MVIIIFCENFNKQTQGDKVCTSKKHFTLSYQVKFYKFLQKCHTGGGCYFKFQGIFLTQGLNPRLLLH